MPAAANKLRLPVLLALTTGPALIVGAGLWLLVGLVPECAADVRESLPSPDGAMTLTVFGIDCGATTGFNTQAAIHPAGEPFSRDSAQVFFAADGLHDLAPRWRADGNIGLDAPEGATITRQLEAVGDFAVAYD